MIAVPPETSWHATISTSGNTHLDSGDAEKVLQAYAAVNGLSSTNTHPWHIVVEYDQFDEDGDKIHSGVFEEYWAAPKKYKVIYKSDALNQTNYATNLGLFRLGDQRWPNRHEIKVQSEVLDPFYYASTFDKYRANTADRSFGPHELHCIVLEKIGGVSNPTQYCFEPDSSTLRYARGEGWDQIVYNDIATVDGRHVGRDVEVTDGGHPYLKLRVKTLELLSAIDEEIFAPPPDAVNLSGKRVNGISMTQISMSFPEWPNALQQKHFVVKLEIVIGKDGRVLTCHAVEGPTEAYKAAENAVKKWIFKPYLVLGEPVEVETHLQLSNN